MNSDAVIITEQVLKRFMAGDQDAYNVVINCYRERLMYFAIHNLRDEELADRFAIDVLTKVWKERETFKSPEDLDLTINIYAIQALKSPLNNLKSILN